MVLRNNGPRVTKLNLAYTKMQENILSKIKDEKLVNEIKKTFMTTYTDHFESSENKIVDKLNCLDEDIKNKRVNLRDIKCEKYIKEIFESYLFGTKEEIKNEILRCGRCADDERKRLRLLVNEKQKIADELDVELLRKESEMENYMKMFEK